MSSLTTYQTLSGGAVQIVTPTPSGAGGLALNQNFQAIANSIVAVASAFVTLTYGSTIATNSTLGNNFEVTLTGATATLSNPTGAVDGQVHRWRIIQDATGGRLLTLGTNFNFGTDLSALTLSTTPNKADYLSAIYRSSTGKFDVLGLMHGF